MQKIKSMTKTKGFTSEQSEFIANKLISVLNENKNISVIEKILDGNLLNFQKCSCKNDIINLFYAGIPEVPGGVDNIKIENVPGLKHFKMTVVYSLAAILNTLKTFHVQLMNDKKVNNKIINELKKISGIITELKDGYTNGNIAIHKDFIGIVSLSDEEKRTADLSIEMFNKNLKPLNDYRKEENQKHKYIKSHKHCIFYKNKKDDFYIINQKDLNIIKKITKDFNVFVSNNDILVFKDNNDKIIGIIAKINLDDLTDFDLLPDIIPTAEETTEETKKEISINSPEAAEMKKVFDSVTEKMVNSPEYKEIIEKQKNEESKKHINPVTGRYYDGKHNIIALNAAMDKYGYKTSEWLGSGQARKLKKQIKDDAPGVDIMIYIENDDGTTFRKIEKVFNVEELEEIKKLEMTDKFINFINGLKNKLRKAV